MPYNVQFPDSDKIIHFKTLDEICKGLNISDFTVNSIIEGTCKFSRDNTKLLKGIIITKTHERNEPELIKNAREQVKQEKLARLREKDEERKRKTEENLQKIKNLLENTF